MSLLPCCFFLSPRFIPYMHMPQERFLVSLMRLVNRTATTTTASSEPARRYTIYDLFKEWRKYDIIDYQARLAEVKVVNMLI